MAQQISNHTRETLRISQLLSNADICTPHYYKPRNLFVSCNNECHDVESYYIDGWLPIIYSPRRKSKGVAFSLSASLSLSLSLSSFFLLFFFMPKKSYYSQLKYSTYGIYYTSILLRGEIMKEMNKYMIDFELLWMNKQGSQNTR